MKDFISLNLLENLFNPRSIAIVGASGSTKKYSMTTAPLKYLIDYKYSGRIYPVNPKYSEIRGYQCFPSIQEIPEKIDVALLLLPGGKVLEELEACGEKGIKGVIVISAGFGETGVEGRSRQHEMASLAEKYGFALLGPNCNGLVNLVHRIPISFGVFLDGKEVRPGRVGFVSQSGAMLSGIVCRAKELGIGFSYLVGTGNEAHVDLLDCLRFLILDPETDVIMALVEGIKDGHKLFEVADLALERGKPIIILKLGSSESGVKSAMSHTGNLAGAFSVYMGAFKQKGILSVNDIDEFLLSAVTLLHSPVPDGDGFGVVTVSGGGAGLVSDLIQAEGLRLGILSEKSLQKLSSFVRWYCSPNNPFDFMGQFLGDISFARKIYDVFIQDPDISVLILVMIPVPQYEELLLRDLIKAGQRGNKPIAVLYLGGSLSVNLKKLLNKKGIPIFYSPKICVKAIGNLIKYSMYRSSGTRSLMKSFKKSKSNERKDKALQLILNREKECILRKNLEKILKLYEIPSARAKSVKSLQSALIVANTIGYPVALKIDNPEIYHKSELDGVKLNLKNPTDLKRCYKKMSQNFENFSRGSGTTRFRIQEMLTGDFSEVILGLFKDPQFGPTMMFGLGGFMTEVFNDVTFRVCPISINDAREMIQEINAYQVLHGFRGKPKADLACLEEVLVNFSLLGFDLSEFISEMEINPLMVFAEGDGVKAVDVTLFHSKMIEH